MTTPTKIDVSNLRDIVCDNCGNDTFEHVYLLKRLSALLSPSGREEIIPIGPPVAPPIFACHKCKKVNQEFVPVPVAEAKERQKTEAKSGIVSSDLPNAPKKLTLID